jgi:hypothetical protein
MRFYGYLFLCVCTMTHSHYFLYPVASLHNEKIILFLKQNSKDNIELIIWDNTTKHAEKGLWSLFNPAGIQILPDETGFSFIDNGRLRIKYFNKRSPKTIEFDQYIYNIHTIHWINSSECYFSAKSINDLFSVFHCSMDGTTQCLISDKQSHCMYPQKINNQLFFIKKTDKKWSITQTYYDKNSSNPHVEIINFNNNPIIFLHMISETEGFVIKHAKAIDREQKNIIFHYYYIYKKNSVWSKKCLFSFTIPSFLLMPDSLYRLYESLLPLIPRIIDKTIYFVDSSKNNDNLLELFVCDIKSLKIKKIMLANQKHIGNLFVPIKCGTQFLYGGEICN